MSYILLSTHTDEDTRDTQHQYSLFETKEELLNRIKTLHCTNNIRVFKIEKELKVIQTIED